MHQNKHQKKWEDLFSEAFPHLKQFASDALTYLLDPAIRFLRQKVSDQQQFGGNKTREHLSEFIANITLGLVASVLNIFSSIAEQYASSKPTNFFNSQDGIGSGDIQTLFDVVLNDSNGQWKRWQVRVPINKYNPQQPYEEILVQTEDTVAMTTMLDILNKAKANILVTGTTGSVNTIVVNDFLHIPTVQDKSLFCQIKISAQSSAKGIQEVLEGILTHRRSNLIGPPVGKQGIVFINDMNTPTPEIYFAQPPIELIRQCVAQFGVYDRKKLTFICLTDTVFVSAFGPPGGGRHEVTRRLTRQFHTIGMPQVGAASFNTIYSFIIVWLLSNQKPSLPATVQELAQPVVDATVEIYQETYSTFLPTPSKSH
ncbi:MAG: putative Dynein heavy chain, partial [Streblomastix strix]